mmetsp:Transcript_82648/g.130740  ORF Transcript_82648/g.130740 Transcript_82648/m.130740 type:complete len:210 (-) Transcript_82648:947-1576(-)
MLQPPPAPERPRTQPWPGCRVGSWWERPRRKRRSPRKMRRLLHQRELMRMKPKRKKKEGSGLKGRSEKRRRKGKKLKTPLQMNPQHLLHPALMMKRRGGRKRSVRRMKSADDAKKRRDVYRKSRGGPKKLQRKLKRLKPGLRKRCAVQRKLKPWQRPRISRSLHQHLLGRCLKDISQVQMKLLNGQRLHWHRGRPTQGGRARQEGSHPK